MPTAWFSWSFASRDSVPGDMVRCVCRVVDQKLDFGIWWGCMAILCISTIMISILPHLVVTQYQASPTPAYHQCTDGNTLPYILWRIDVPPRLFASFRMQWYLLVPLSTKDLVPVKNFHSKVCILFQLFRTVFLGRLVAVKIFKCHLLMLWQVKWGHA